MNKKLVALAVSAIAAGAASAQTANVTLYGIIDTYLASERGSSPTAAANKVSTDWPRVRRHLRFALGPARL